MKCPSCDRDLIKTKRKWVCPWCGFVTNRKNVKNMGKAKDFTKRRERSKEILDRELRPVGPAAYDSEGKRLAKEVGSGD